ncbi:hypothetical protein HUK80_12255 [Flavobacterium sp. MAH-1]|uniref:Universal stress protein family protein n=1 Tax=Flavobacterium agri TaxID=2743471 RepID=A0A7Y8Y394_9FLAO|nr:hypothetical protein [Flavobacterium agri]NUY81673.1 hypothetical protein [Flavobacterium agri]NYA71697.1 hypothetical protein [Flavobacterium agri]
MKNILIPTVLEKDTLASVESAISYANGQNFDLVLLLLNETDNAYSASAYLRNSKPAFSASQQKTLEDCQRLALKFDNIKLHVQRQSSISAPLLRNLLSVLEIGFVIVPKSFRESSKKINRHCLGLLANSHCPILNLCDAPTSEMQKALYLEYAESKLQVSDLQQRLDGKFAFRIVSQARINKQEERSLDQLLLETITRNDIDLLVETRKPTKVKLGKKFPSFHDDLKLPVLSVFEEIR